MKDATLGFCGLTVTRVTSFGPVKSSTAAKRDNWLDKTRRRAQSLQSGAITPLRKLSLTVFAWLKAIRFQFYPMTFLAYAAGAMGAQHNGYGFSNATFWLGFLWIFCLELATVFSNEYFDYHTDRHNRYFSPFTGGSRVIVDGLISFKELRTGIFVSLAGAGAFLVLLLQHINFSSLSIIALLVLVVLAIGYTVPPLKLSYRGFGELTVGITHSFAVIFCGYCFQGGNIADSFFWLLGLPLFLSVLPSILLAGIPDRHADLMAAKNTVVVRIGVKGTALLAVLCTWLAIAAVVAFRLLGVLSPFFDGVLYVVVPHAVLLTWLLVKFTKEPTPPKRIDAIIATALGYLVWFILIPLLNLRG
jgi:1,4-dihydroxy-2-naphthoate octaprenyltransferase